MDKSKKIHPREDAIDRLVEAWGQLASIFGFNRSTGRVSALLLVSDEALSLSAIAERLQISRGNASMCLKELRRWGVVRRIAEPGDRQDYYVGGEDLWRQMIEIARERKRREFDPAAHDALEALEELEGEPAANRLATHLGTLDQIASQLFANDDALVSLIGLLQSGFGNKGVQS